MDGKGTLPADMEADSRYHRADQGPSQAKAIWARRESRLETDFFREGN